MARKTLDIRYGALAPKLAEQLKAQGLTVPEKILKRCQAGMDAVVELHLRGFMTDSEAQKARKRIHKHLTEAVEPT